LSYDFYLLHNEILQLLPPIINQPYLEITQSILLQKAAFIRYTRREIEETQEIKNRGYIKIELTQVVEKILFKNKKALYFSDNALLIGIH